MRETADWGSWRSALVKHATGSRHDILFCEAKVLFYSYSLWQRVIQETLEINISPNAINRNTGLQLCAT